MAKRKKESAEPVMEGTVESAKPEIIDGEFSVSVDEAAVKKAESDEAKKSEKLETLKSTLGGIYEYTGKPVAKVAKLGWTATKKVAAPVPIGARMGAGIFSEIWKVAKTAFYAGLDQLPKGATSLLPEEIIKGWQSGRDAAKKQFAGKDSKEKDKK